MWLCTTRSGFLSVVLADTAPGSGVPDPDQLMVRARRRSHLEELLREHPALAEHPIIESSPACDYRWRMVVPKQVFAQAMFDTVMATSYRNVKSEAHKHSDVTGDDYCHALHGVWSVLRRLQQ